MSPDKKADVMLEAARSHLTQALARESESIRVTFERKEGRWWVEVQSVEPPITVNVRAHP